MKLKDEFWIKLYDYDKGYHRYDDTFRIIKLAKENFNIELSFLEALNLWEYISGCIDAGWLDCNDEEIIEALNSCFKKYEEYIDS